MVCLQKQLCVFSFTCMRCPLPLYWITHTQLWWQVTRKNKKIKTHITISVGSDTCNVKICRYNYMLSLINITGLGMLCFVYSHLLLTEWELQSDIHCKEIFVCTLCMLHLMTAIWLLIYIYVTQHITTDESIPGWFWNIYYW